VIVDVTVPTKLSRAEREALLAYADATGEPITEGGGLLERVRDKLA
jgi:hypothetical protein